MTRRWAFPVLPAVASILLAALPAMTAQAAGHSRFRPVLIGGMGTVVVSSLPAHRSNGVRAQAHPFLKVGAGASHSGSAPTVATVGAAAATGSTQEVLTSFKAVTLDQQVTSFGTDQFVTPPHNGLAAGPNHVVEMVTDTGTLWTTSETLAKTFAPTKFFPSP